MFWCSLGGGATAGVARAEEGDGHDPDPFNASRLNTIIAAVITSNTGLAAMPGNVFLPAASSGLPKDSVVNVTALVTLDKAGLEAETGQLPASLVNEVDRGLRRVLGL
jgi:mRNA interferase MazF